METFILWVGFAGAWLLFAGPIYQAALELGEEGMERDRLEKMGESAVPPPPVSNWWWLIPPVKFLLERRRSAQFKRAFIATLSREDLEVLTTFMNKAFAWLLVAIGGLCIAMKETYELAHHSEWPTAVFWILVAGMAAANIVHTTLRLRHEELPLDYGSERGAARQHS
jgi:ABC-type glycerol-3-phosphate transport system permease component